MLWMTAKECFEDADTNHDGSADAVVFRAVDLGLTAAPPRPPSLGRLRDAFWAELDREIAEELNLEAPNQLRREGGAASMRRVEEGSLREVRQRRWRARLAGGARLAERGCECGHGHLGVGGVEV